MNHKRFKFIFFSIILLGNVSAFAQYVPNPHDELVLVSGFSENYDNKEAVNNMIANAQQSCSGRGQAQQVKATEFSTVTGGRRATATFKCIASLSAEEPNPTYRSRCTKYSTDFPCTVNGMWAEGTGFWCYQSWDENGRQLATLDASLKAFENALVTCRKAGFSNFRKVDSGQIEGYNTCAQKVRIQFTCIK
jgi:hypothetical protein